MEILFEAQAGGLLPQKVTEQATRTGDRYRIEVAETDVYAALQELKTSQARILSVAPLRPTLEDYFFKLVDQQKNQASESEVRSGGASR
jgi:hypothetical protein